MSRLSDLFDWHHPATIVAEVRRLLRLRHNGTAVFTDVRGGYWRYQPAWPYITVAKSDGITLPICPLEGSA